MIRKGVRLVVAVAGLGALAMSVQPVSASASQIVAFGPGAGTLTISGDATKEIDQITVDYEAGTGDFVVGRDIGEPLAPGCSRDATEPLHRVRCPGQGIKRIRILGGEGADSVRVGVDLTEYPGDARFFERFRGKVEARLGGGDDQFEGGMESDVVDLGEGENRAITGGGDDRVTAGEGDDSISTGATAMATLLRGRVAIRNEAGVSVSSGGGDDTVRTGGGADQVEAGSGDDSVETGAGDDSVSTGAGNDKVAAGSGNDTIKGGPGNDELAAEQGNDTVQGGPGVDHLFGGPGADLLSGGPGADYLIGGPGGPDRCNGGPGVERSLVGCEVSAAHRGSTLKGP